LKTNTNSGEKEAKNNARTEPKSADGNVVNKKKRQPPRIPAAVGLGECLVALHKQKGKGDY